MKLLKNLIEKYRTMESTFKLDILNRKCPVCGLELIEKEDWVFCPKNSTEIPDCDSLYHIAKNIKTGQGWTTVKEVL